jgi:hypothetical protein
MKPNLCVLALATLAMSPPVHAQKQQMGFLIA